MNQSNSQEFMQNFLASNSLSEEAELTRDELKDELNASNEFIKLCDLNLNEEYDITGGSVITTVHGPKVQLMLNNEYKLLMPERYTKILTNAKIQKLVDSKFKLLYKGKKDMYKGQSKHDIMFI